MKKVLVLFTWFLLFALGCSAQNTVSADEDFDVSVKNPAYTKNHPKVLFDEAHRNLHTTDRLFKPFADLITNDGYKVTPNKENFSAKVLKDFDILIIANARGNTREESAFTDEECDAVKAWVKSGGSLLLIADHAPFGFYAEKLSKRFGVEMTNSYTNDRPNRHPELGQILFSRENKLLQDHPITNGRNAGEKVDRVVSFTGQSLSIPKNAQVILKLSDTAIDTFPRTEKPEISAKGKAQMLTLKYGKGKVLISGEAAMFSAQKLLNGFKFGMNASEDIENRQLVLNIMHWLSGFLK